MLRVSRRCLETVAAGLDAETMLLDDGLREMIVARSPIRQLKDAARANGTRFLREAAVDLVRAGVTDLKEINRVTFVA